MKLNRAGERAVIELARKICRRGRRVKVGIGDDAAVLDIDGADLVATTDMLVAETHFPPGTTPEQMARKAVVSNLSDLAAMGAEPLAVLFSVALPRDTEMSYVKRILKAMDSVAAEYGTYLVGGDLDESGGIILSGFALGLVRGGKLLKRSGAKVGDLVAVTGELGGSSAGLKILSDKIPKDDFLDLVRAQLEPRARLKEGLVLSKSGKVNSAIDLSDGLASNLWQLSEESGIKITIERESLPENPLVKNFSKKHGLDPDDFVLYGGEDFELVFTLKPENWEEVRRGLEKVGCNATVIGRVEKGKGVNIEENMKVRELPDRGYEHFR